MRIWRKMAPCVAVVGRVDRAAELAVAALLLALLITGPANAEGERWYAGLGLGLAAYSEDESNRVCDEFDLNCQQDEDDVAFKIMGGYQFNPYIPVEFGFNDWGAVGVEDPGLQVDVLAFEASGVYLAAMPELPLGKHFSIFGELGVSLINTEVEVVQGGPLDVLLGGGASEDVWAPVYGLGVAGHLKRWTFRLQWERIDPDTDFDFGPIQIAAPVLDTFGLSVIFRF